MKKFTDTEIAKIRADINKEIVYCGICNGYGTGRIWKSRNQQYIHYSHFGAAAIDNSDDQLRWLLETIFEDCEDVAPAIWSDYHINYVPIDEHYKGIDYSVKHPNTFGK